jgi:hypothetical protein
MAFIAQFRSELLKLPLPLSFFRNSGKFQDLVVLGHRSSNPFNALVLAIVLH